MTKTCPVMNQVHPVWNFQFTLGVPPVPNGEDVLFLAVFKGQCATPFQMLGTTQLALADLLNRAQSSVDN